MRYRYRHHVRTLPAGRETMEWDQDISFERAKEYFDNDYNSILELLNSIKTEDDEIITSYIPDDHWRIEIRNSYTAIIHEGFIDPEHMDI